MEVESEVGNCSLLFEELGELGLLLPLATLSSVVRFCTAFAMRPFRVRDDFSKGSEPASADGVVDPEGLEACLERRVPGIFIGSSTAEGRPVWNVPWS